MSEPKVVRCSSCGSPHIEVISDRVGRCQNCKSTMLLPRKNEEIIALLNSAQVYRATFNYDLAIQSYQLILDKDPYEVAAYEGILLSKYGIEYVKDNYSGKFIPTCHRANFQSIYEDEHCKTLLSLVNGTEKSVITEKIQTIDKLQKAIEKQVNNEQSYDIFISYKATDQYGNKTEDSVIAREIYDDLIKRNYKVFFAEKSLEDKIGTDYEPIIFKALNTCKLFILVGTAKENIESTWVRNEWSRFIERIRNDHDLSSRSFIPVFRNMSPYDMPKVNNNYVQSVDAGKIGYCTTIVDGVEKLLKTKPSSNTLDTNQIIYNLNDLKTNTHAQKKQLKKQRWNEFKKNKGIKKWLYMAFLYSSNVLSFLAIIPSSFFDSHFTNSPAHAITWSLWILTLVLMLLSMFTHIPKFGLKLFVNILNPILFMFIGFSTYFYISWPQTTSGANWQQLAIGEYHQNGFVLSEDSFIYNESGQATERIEDMLQDRYAYLHTKVIDGKKTLILPDSGNYAHITSVYITIPYDVEAIVLPKNAVSVTLKLKAPENFKTIYCYGIDSTSPYQAKSSSDKVTSIHIYSLSRNSSSPYTDYRIYYENATPRCLGFDPNYDNEKLIQQDLEFYD